MRSDRARGQRTLRGLIDGSRTAGTRTSFSPGVAGDGSPGAFDGEVDDGGYGSSLGGTVTIMGLPKVVLGHPLLGAFHGDGVDHWEL